MLQGPAPARAPRPRVRDGRAVGRRPVEPGRGARRLNPGLRVPTLVLDDGRPLGESNAILWYLGDGTQYVSTDAYERAQTLQWMFFEQYSHEPYIAVARFWLAYSGAPEKFTERLPERMKGGYAALDAMEAHLDGREFLVGERYSIADISLYAYTHVAHEGDFDLDPYPAIRAWLERVRRAAGSRHHRRVTVRVRFAPSPTGSLHLGNALTAVANRRFADENGGLLVLRIDDTDASRTVVGGEDAIVDDLSWLRVGSTRGRCGRASGGACTRKRQDERSTRAQRRARRGRRGATPR